MISYTFSKSLHTAARASKPVATSKSSSLVLAYIAFGVIAPFALPLKSSITHNQSNQR